jgi:hypothetical protein
MAKSVDATDLIVLNLHMDYGNLLSDSFQIQRNLGMKNGQSWANPFFEKKNEWFSN